MAGSPSKLKLVLKALGALAAVGALTLGVVASRAGAEMDARAASLNERLAAFHARPAARPVLVGEPRDGDAVDEYRGVEWVLGPGERVQPWPTMARPALERDHPAANRIDLGGLLTQAHDALRAGQSVPVEAAGLVDTYASVIDQLRQGVRASRCDWGLRPEDGVNAELPNLIALRQAAQLLALSAAREPEPSEALRRGLEVVAFGRDVARQGTLLGHLVGGAIEELGLRSLERTLRARALPAAAYEEVVATLGRVEPVTLRDVLDLERLGMEAEAARLAGRAPAGGAAGVSGALPLTARLPGFSTLFWAREWRGYVELFEGLQAAAEAPRPERTARLAEVEARVAAAGLFFAGMVIPNVGAIADHLDRAQALRDCARVLAAAHLHRLEAGAFPTDAGALAERLGGIFPHDPLSPTGVPLVFEVEGDEVRCYSVGPDGVDDGGQDLAVVKDARDAGLTTRAPAH